jgi:hypothetical protein
MKITYKLLSSLAIGVLVVSCGGGSGSDGDISAGSSVFPAGLPEALPMECNTGSGSDIYVSNAGDDNTGDGSQGNPYATITHVLTNVAIDGDTVRLATGTYDGGSGESFPLSMRGPGNGSSTAPWITGVSIVGDLDTANRGAGYIIDAGNGNTIRATQCALITGVTIKNSGGQNRRGILVPPGDDVEINSNTFDSAGRAIFINATDPEDLGVPPSVTFIINNNFFDNTTAVDALSSVLVQNNDFNSGSGVGVKATFNNIYFDQESGDAIGQRLADLGGGSLGSLGGNIFCNGSSDFIALDGTPTGQFHELIAEDNYWTGVSAVNEPSQSQFDYDTENANIQRALLTTTIITGNSLGDGCPVL